eukprot:gnl/Dysnectes_brevis/813_a898_4653.p1 GENE.gnl/Dysnectes_brevis/813_a898_4653~~gnl/Dysnectes_brevis/813_a898_4653.p1  ORF type:complete len:373 (-),score=146.56 gnl/Dysnectes_brevis/813_a898_4653:69-1187(-)
MDFVKYSPIIQHYKDADLRYSLTVSPSIYTQIYEITEKLHGANFCLSATATPDTGVEVTYSRRTATLNPGEKFYGYLPVMTGSSLTALTEHIKTTAAALLADHPAGVNLRLYGELYGGGIQRGVDYGPAKCFRWYSLMLNGDYLAPARVDALLEPFIELKVPLVGYTSVPLQGRAVSTPQEAMDALEADGMGSDFDLEALPIDARLERFKAFVDGLVYKFPSALSPSKDICEGVVVKPYFTSCALPLPEDEDVPLLFMIKKKTENFAERGVKPKKGSVPPSSSVQAAIEVCTGYVCEERTQSLFSKYGVIEEFKQIKQYTGYYLEDVMDDVKGDADADAVVSQVTKKEHKQLLGVLRREIASILRKTITRTK